MVNPSVCLSVVLSVHLFVTWCQIKMDVSKQSSVPRTSVLTSSIYGALDYMRYTFELSSLVPVSATDYMKNEKLGTMYVLYLNA